MKWIAPPRREGGHLSSQAMIFDMATYIMERFYIPKWAYCLGFKKLKKIDEAYTEFVPFMKERIAQREEQLQRLSAGGEGVDSAKADLTKDIFGRLVNARLSDGKLTLSDDELIGNAFIFVSETMFNEVL